MAPKGNKNDSKGLSYVAATPSFLKNFGQPQPPPTRAGESSTGGRAALPSRPEDGRWAGGSDGEEEEDEWDAKFGGGGDEGPQVVVLKEGRHLTAEEVKRERSRATGKKSHSPPPSLSKLVANMSGKPSAPAPTIEPSKAKPLKPVIPKPNTSKRKLVGAAAGEEDPDEEGKKKADGTKGKRKKKSKGMLSFNEAEGEE